MCTNPSASAKARFVRVSASKARRVIDLVRGKSVAEALDMPLGTVKNLLFRARKRLMELARPEEVQAA